MRDHAVEHERLVTANAVRGHHNTWAAAVGKWTAPVKTIEKVATSSRAAKAVGGKTDKAQV
jgi:hypothetical protein